jgi:replication factor A2
MLGSPRKFLNDSQSIGSSQLFGVSQGAGIAGAPRKEDQHSCLPATVRLVEASLEECPPGGEPRFHGREVGQLILVGVVESLLRTANSIEFTLNDASGRLQVRHYFTGDASDASSKLQNGRYAGVVGNVRTSPVHHFGASGLWHVESADEVCYHMLEVAHAALKLRQCEQKVSNTPESKQTSRLVEAPSTLDAATLPWATPMKGEAPQPGGAAPPEGNALKEAVKDFVQREGAGREEGVALAEITGGVGGAVPESVRRAIEALVAEGEIYQTVDEEHFQVL